MVWARFTREFEDGFARYQKGGVYDIHPDKFRVYTTQYFLSPDGGSQTRPPKAWDDPICVACDPPPNEPAGKGRSGKMGMYRFLDSVCTPLASYGAGQMYELPVEIGDKYTRRGLAQPVENVPAQHREPETAMRPSGRR